jgi:hypothetical protein
MDEPTSAILERAVALWRKAQVVYEGPTQVGFLEPLAAVFEIAKGHPNCHDELVGLLSSDSQLVVAYALLTLQMMGSPVLANLPENLLKRREQVTLDIGSFRNSMDLGGLARQVQKRARQRRQEAADGGRPT